MENEHIARTLSYTEKSALLKRQSNQCIWCGCALKEYYSSRCTTEHIMPIAIYKWTEINHTQEENEELLKILNSSDNLVISCSSCNMYKGSSIIEPKELKKMMFNGSKYRVCKYENIYNKCNKRMIEYLSILREKLDGQGGKCYCCKKTRGINDVSLRRLNSSESRSPDNSIAVCYICNVKYGDNMKRLLMWSK